MKDQQNRAMMAELYRIMEKYEIPPDCDTDQEIIQYFGQVSDDIKLFYRTYWEQQRNLFARELSSALYTAISNRFTNRSLPL